jgi:peptide/nickel transport system substrate-binding protein
MTGVGNMSRIDPATNVVSFTTELSAADPNAGATFLPFVEFAGGAAWTASDEVGKVWRVNPSGRATEYDVGIGSRALAPLGDTMWIAVQDQGKLIGIDVTTGTKREITIGHQVWTVASDGDELMVAVDRTPEERIAALDGEVLTIAAPFGPFYTPDPPVNASFEYRQTVDATCAPLLRYRNEPAPAGWELVPEVAVAMPDVSADGRTYTFTIRDGFAFSPPVGEPVTAEHYRFAIERALDPRMEAWGAQFLDDVEGAIAYRAGEADHVSGIQVEGESLTFQLTEPSGDFLDRLALTYYCPVPLGTPVVRAGVDPTPPMAAAGPYYPTYHLPGELYIIEKNPKYGGQREQPWDAIAWRTGFPPGEAIAHVESGETDAAVAGAFEPLLNAQSDVAVAWGPGSDAAAGGDQRWFGGARFGSDYLALNPARLFADVDIRRAVSLAIDREALAAWFGEAPFGGLLAPSAKGSLPADTAVPEPDLAAARDLMAGRTGTVVMGIWPECPECASIGETVKGALQEIGISVEVRVFDDLAAEIADPDTQVDVYNGFLDTYYADPVALMGLLAETGWIGETNLAELDRLNGLTGQERIDGAAALATRVSDDEVLAIPFGYPIYPMYLGQDVGCGYVQPAIGAVDLLSLCREP